MKNLINAIDENDINLAKQLLDNIADVNTMYNGYHPLINTAEKGYKEIAILLLERGANINLRNKKGTTALMIAAKNGHTETISMLLARGADINNKNNNGWTALMIAALNGHK